MAYFGIKIRVRLDFSVKIILSILSDFLWQDKGTQKHFALGKTGILVNFIFAKLLSFFSGQRKSERIERIIFTEKSNLACLSLTQDHESSYLYKVMWLFLNNYYPPCFQNFSLGLVFIVSTMNEQNYKWNKFIFSRMWNKEKSLTSYSCVLPWKNSYFFRQFFSTYGTQHCVLCCRKMQNKW